MSASITTARSIPFPLRHAIITLEPIAAAGGAFLTYFDPAHYYDTMTHGVLSYASDTKFLYTTISGLLLYWIFMEAVVLRIFDDLRLWRLSCVGMLLSDVLYFISTVEAVGGWEVWMQVDKWTSDDWLILLGTVPFAVVRICIVLGVGLEKARSPVKAVKHA